MELKNAERLTGTLSVPGDKSISHRAVMFGAISKGTTEITNFLQGEDCLSTIDCFRKMGISIEQQGMEKQKIVVRGKGRNTVIRTGQAGMEKQKIIVRGKGLYGLSAFDGCLDVGNSGTTARLLSGILSGQRFSSCLTGDASIQKRPMKRILSPLSEMGAHVCSQKNNGCAPLLFEPAELMGISYHSPVASAQVKSCILLAGLYAQGSTSVTEPVLSRNHTELMLSAFGADLKAEGCTVSIQPKPHLEGMKIEVPGDISSAAYFIAAGLLVKNSEILIQNVGINPTRDGMLRAALAMGGNIQKLNERTVSNEAVCDLLISSSHLRGCTIGGEIIPSLIDEIPILAVMAAFAEGTTIIKDAAELKVKESNRIDTITDNLRRMGADITPTADGMVIHGNRELLHGADFDSYMDHRIAMSFAVAALALCGSCTMKNAACAAVSYPGFYEELYRLG